MKRKLNLYIFTIVIVCTSVISGLLYFYVQNIINGIIEDDKKIIVERLVSDIDYMQVTLDLVEVQAISKYKNDVISLAKHLTTKWKNPKDVPLDTLYSIISKLKVDNIHLINKDGLIINSTNSDRVNYNIRNEGENFYKFYIDAYSSSSFRVYSCGINSYNNLINIYLFYHPEGAKYAIKIPVCIKHFIRQKDITFVNKGFIYHIKDILYRNSKIISSVDVYNLNDKYHISLVDNKSRLKLDSTQLQMLLKNKNLTINTGVGQQYYTIVKINSDRQNFLPVMVLRVDFSYTIFSLYGKNILTFLVIILLVIILVVSLISPLIIDKLLIKKIDVINHNLNALRCANYIEFKQFNGSDELSAIAENIVHVKESVVEREEQLKRAKQQAESADRLKSSFLANMSHEIRTPLNAVVGFAQLLKDLNPSEKDRNKYIDLINSNSLKLLQLISDIIDFSQIEAGHLKIISQPVCIKDFFTELESFAVNKLQNEQVIYNSKEINILFDNKDISEDECFMSDSYRLKQILEQLVDNAIKFTCTGEIHIGYKININTISFYVSDTGVGISKENISKIFGRFIQVEEYLTRQYGGTGLGLAISNELVKMMNGTITVESELNKGSKFTVTIPFNPKNK